MTFNEVMALILPSMIGLLFYLKLTEEKLNIMELFGILSLFMFLTNFICYTIVYYFREKQQFLFTPSFTIKYSMTALVIVLIIVIVYRFLELNVKVKLKVENKKK